MSTTTTGTTPTIGFDTYLALVQLQADYSAALDAGDWARWPEFFTADGVYRLVPRENFERGFPLATLAFDSKAMLQDRVYGISETIFHDPYYQRHVVSAPLTEDIARWPVKIEGGRVWAAFD